MNELMIFGDSVLKGVMFDADTGRYRLCREPRFQPLAERGVDVENRSRMGATIREGLRLLEQETPAEPAQVVLLEYGGNDCNYDWKAVSRAPREEHRPAVPIEEFAESYRRAIRKARELARNVAVCSVMPLDSRKFMNFISRGNCYDSILSWLGDVGILYRWQQLYNDVAMDVARSENCPVVDIRRFLMVRHDFDDLLCADGIHPTSKGHKLLGSLLCRELAPLLGSSPGKES